MFDQINNIYTLKKTVIYQRSLSVVSLKNKAVVGF